jgi:hypothetical protein
VDQHFLLGTTLSLALFSTHRVFSVLSFTLRQCANCPPTCAGSSTYWRFQFPLLLLLLLLLLLPLFSAAPVGRQLLLCQRFGCELLLINQGVILQSGLRCGFWQDGPTSKQTMISLSRQGNKRQANLLLRL